MGRLKQAIVGLFRFVALLLLFNYALDFAAGFTSKHEVCEKALAIRDFAIVGFIGALDGCRVRWGDK